VSFGENPLFKNVFLYQKKKSAKRHRQPLKKHSLAKAAAPSRKAIA
jgi:hypothetical protein